MVAPTETPAEEGTTASPPRRRRGTRQRVWLGWGVVFALLAVAFGGAILFAGWELSSIDRHDLTLAEVGADQPQNYLVVGSDSRQDIAAGDPDASAFLGNEDPDTFGQRADTIMVVRVDPILHEVHVLSLQRDLWIPIAGTGESQRINTAYASEDGRQRLIDTINEDFGIPINHYVEVDFRGFEGIVDSLDGIPLTFDRPVRDKHSGLYVDTAGCRVLDGAQALAFARSRHLEYLTDDGRWKPDPSADLGRISRQQVFMRAVLERAAGESIDVGDFGDGLGLLTTVSDYVGLDSQLDADLMGALVREFEGFNGDNLYTYTLPVTPFTTDGGAAVLEYEELPSQDILNVFRGLPPGTIDPGLVSVTVWNGSGTAGQAAAAQTGLEAAGFEVPEIDDAPAQVGVTTVRYAPGMWSAANLVARHLDSGAVLAEDSSLDDDEVVLVTGPDFGSVLVEAAEVAPVPSMPSSTEGGGASSDPVEVESAEAEPTTSTTAPGILAVEVAEGAC